MQARIATEGAAAARTHSFAHGVGVLLDPCIRAAVQLGATPTPPSTGFAEPVTGRTRKMVRILVEMV
jgi:hypothetical protein